MGVELAVAGDKEPTNEDDEVVSYVEPNRGVYKKVIIRDGKVAGAILLGRRIHRAAIAAGVRQG